MFILPSKEELRKKWIQRINRPNWTPSKYTRICSSHFRKKDFRITKKGLKRLKEGSLPCFNLSELNYEDKDLDVEEKPGPSSQCETQDLPVEKKIEVFCPNCNTELSHIAERIVVDLTKELVANVYRYLEQEYDELKTLYDSVDLSPLSKIIPRTAMAIGVSEATVLQILKEEEERSTVCQSVEAPPKRARKRTRKTKRSKQDNTEEIGDNDEETSLQQHQDEIETLVVKVEPSEYYEESETMFTPVDVKLEPTDGEASGPQVDPIAVEVKAESRNDEGKRTNETLAPDVPPTNIGRGRKKQRTDDVTTQQHTQGHTSTARASSSVPTRELDENSSLAEGAIKTEEIEIHEEGFS